MRRKILREKFEKPQKQLQLNLQQTLKQKKNKLWICFKTILK